MKIKMAAKKKKRFMFLESFQTFDVRLFHAMLFDLVGLLIFLGIAAMFYMIFGRLTQAFPRTVTSNTGYIVSVALLAALAVLLHILNITIFKRLAYRYTKGRTRDMRTWFWFTLVWTVPWFFIFLSITLAAKDQWRGILIFIFGLVYIMLTAAARADMRKDARDTVRNAFSLFFSSRMWVAYLFIGVVFLAVVLGVSWTYVFGRAVMASMLLFMFLLCSAWARHYLALTIEN